MAPNRTTNLKLSQEHHELMLNILSHSVGDNLQRTAEKFGDNIAIKDSSGVYTYRELMRVSDQICFTLQEKGLKHGEVVALFFSSKQGGHCGRIGRSQGRLLFYTNGCE